MSRLIPSYIEQGLRIEQLERELVAARAGVVKLKGEAQYGATFVQRAIDAERELAELREELNDRRKFAYAVEQALDGLKGDYVEIIKELRKDAEKYRYCFNAAIDAAMKEVK